VPDGRRDEHLDLGVQTGDPDRSGGGRVGGPVWADDTEGLQLVLSSEREVADLDVLEQGELDGVTADRDLPDVLQLLCPVEGHEVVHRLHDDLVPDIRTHVHPIVKVVHDVSTGKRMPRRDCRV